MNKGYLALTPDLLTIMMTISAVFAATQAAMRTAQNEKHEALRNGILNVAAGQTLDETLIGSFISCINQFSPAHLCVLAGKSGVVRKFESDGSPVHGGRRRRPGSCAASSANTRLASRRA